MITINNIRETCESLRLSDFTAKDRSWHGAISSDYYLGDYSKDEHKRLDHMIALVNRLTPYYVYLHYTGAQWYQIRVVYDSLLVIEKSHISLWKQGNNTITRWYDANHPNDCMEVKKAIIRLFAHNERLIVVWARSGVHYIEK